MPLTIHHLRRSQSERIVWLCEELAALIPEFEYELVHHDRDPTTALAPPSLKDMSPAKTAPVMVDSTISPSVLLAESQAIVEYIIQVHGQGNFAVAPGSPEYPHYLSWYNFANGSLQPGLTRLGTVDLVLKAIARMNGKEKHGAMDTDADADAQEAKANNTKATDPLTAMIKVRLLNHLDMINTRLADTTYLAGHDLTAADIMIVFSLTTMRGFYPYSLENYPHILRYLGDVAKRPAYKRAIEKAEQEMEPMITAEVESFDFAVFK